MVTPTAGALRTRREFKEGVKRGIRYWSNYLRSKPGRMALAVELGNIKSVVRHAQAEKLNAVGTTSMLMAVFPIVLEYGGPDWIQYYQKATGISPSKMPSLLLFQTGSLYWSHGKNERAQSYFAKGFRLAKTKDLKAMNAIGNFLCAWAEGKRIEINKQLVRLSKMIDAPGLSAPIRARIHLVAGLAEFAANKYQNALVHFELALPGRHTRDERIQMLLAVGLCHQAQGRHKHTLKAYNRAAKLLQSMSGREKELARIEVLRASIHYQNRKSGASHRLKPALAALARAANTNQKDERFSRAILEEYIGKTYSRAGNIQRGIVYLNSALSLTKENEDQRLFTEIFKSLAKLEQKSPVGALGF